MSRRCLLFVSSAVLGLSALVLSLSACGSSSSAAPVSPASSYALTAAALKPGSVTAGSASTSTITVTILDQAGTGDKRRHPGGPGSRREQAPRHPAVVGDPGEA